MIAPGALPRYRARLGGKRGPGLRSGSRARRPLPAPRGTADTQIMLFDQRAALPVATVASERWGLEVIASRLRGARNTAWLWVRPRMLPLAAALVGAAALLASTSYLSSLARGPENASAARAHMQIQSR